MTGCGLQAVGLVTEDIPTFWHAFDEAGPAGALEPFRSSASYPESAAALSGPVRSDSRRLPADAGTVPVDQLGRCPDVLAEGGKLLIAVPLEQARALLSQGAVELAR